MLGRNLTDNGGIFKMTLGVESKLFEDILSSYSSIVDIEFNIRVPTLFFLLILMLEQILSNVLEAVNIDLTSRYYSRMHQTTKMSSHGG